MKRRMPAKSGSAADPSPSAVATFAPLRAGRFFFAHDEVAHVENDLDVFGGFVLVVGSGAVDRRQELFLAAAPVQPRAEDLAYVRPRHQSIMRGFEFHARLNAAGSSRMFRA